MQEVLSMKCDSRTKRRVSVMQGVLSSGARGSVSNLLQEYLSSGARVSVSCKGFCHLVQVVLSCKSIHLLQEYLSCKRFCPMQGVLSSDARGSVSGVDPMQGVLSPARVSVICCKSTCHLVQEVLSPEQ